MTWTPAPKTSTTTRTTSPTGMPTAARPSSDRPRRRSRSWRASSSWEGGNECSSWSSTGRATAACSSRTWGTDVAGPSRPLGPAVSWGGHGQSHEGELPRGVTAAAPRHPTASARHLWLRTARGRYRGRSRRRPRRAARLAGGRGGPHLCRDADPPPDATPGADGPQVPDPSPTVRPFDRGEPTGPGGEDVRQLRRPGRLLRALGQSRRAPGAVRPGGGHAEADGALGFGVHGAPARGALAGRSRGPGAPTRVPAPGGPRAVRLPR